VFVVDRTTDRGFPRATLRVLWSAVGPDSPNRRSPPPTARLLAVERSTAAEIRGLMAMLLDAVARNRQRAADARPRRRARARTLGFYSRRVSIQLTARSGA
jgi:hypothetical protein